MGRIGRLFDNNNILQVNDQGLFTPSYELAKTLIEQKDKDLDDFEDARGKLQEKLAIAHMDTENDTKEARELLEAYQKELDNISIMAMNDRLNTGLYRRNLTDLQGRMMKDAQTGRWYDISRRAADEVAWKEQNAQIMKDDPSLYNRLHDLYKQEHEELGRKYHEDGISNWRVPWQAIVPKPNLTDDESLKAYSLIKENMWDKQRGMYIYNNKEVSEEEAARIAVNRLLSDKNVFGYAAQMARLGEKGYLDANGNLIPPMIEDVSGKPQINPLSAFAPILQEVIDIIAFKQQTVRPDPVALAAADRAAAQMARRGSGKPEKEKEPSKSYVTRVANTPISLDKINDTSNHIKNGKVITDADRDEMERVMHVQRNVPLQMRDADNQELTLGQLGVNDGAGFYTRKENKTDKKEGRNQITYMDRNEVDERRARKAAILRSLPPGKLFTMMLSRHISVKQAGVTNDFDIYETPDETISSMINDALHASSDPHKKTIRIIEDRNLLPNVKTVGFRYVVKPDGDGDYSYDDIVHIRNAAYEGSESVIRLANFMANTTATQFTNDSYTAPHGLIVNRWKDWEAYYSGKLSQFGLTSWHLDNDPRIPFLLDAGQTLLGKDAYIGGRTQYEDRVVGKDDKGDAIVESVPVLKRGYGDSFYMQMMYEGRNSRLEKLYKNAAKQ